MGFVSFVAAFLYFVTKEDVTYDSSKFRIMCWSGNSTLGDYANKFKKENPHVDIEIINYQWSDLEKYNSDLTTMLMAGNAPDVFLMTDETYYNFADSAYVLNLYPLMEEDKDFHQEEYYTSIFEAFEIDGRLTAMPFKYNSIYMGIAKNFYDKTTPGYGSLRTVNVRQMLDLYDSIDESERKYLYPEFNLSPLNMFQKTAYLDITSKTSNLDSDEFIELMEDSRKSVFTHKYYDNRDVNKIYPYELNFFTHPHEVSYFTRDTLLFNDFVFVEFFDYKPYYFLPYKKPYKDFYYNSTIPGIPSYAEAPVGDIIVDLKPLVTQDGRHIIFSDTYASINSASKHIDLAWDFFKACTSYEYNIPNSESNQNTIKREVSEARLQFLFEDYMKRDYDGPITDAHRKDFQDTIAFMTKAADEPKFVFRRVCIADINKVLVDFQNSTDPADKIAKELHNRMSIYFIERD